MTRTRGLFFAAIAAALVSVAGSSAHAAFGDFSYTSAVTIPAGGVTVVGPTTITLAGLPETGLNAAQSGTDIVFGSVQVTSTASVDTSIGNIPYRFVLTITNNDVGNGVGTVTINGVLSGTARNNATNISNLYTAPLVSQVQIGNALFIVDVGPGPPAQGTFTAPSPQRLGLFGAHVTAVPEPGSMALLGMGVVGLLGVYRRRLRA